MDTLRIILIIAGLALIAGIYLREYRLQGTRREDSGVDEPLEIEGFSAADQLYPEPWEGEGFSARTEAPSVEEMPGMGETGERDGTGEVAGMVVVLSLMALKTDFEGPEIVATAEASGLHFGQMDIFHYSPEWEGAPEQPWFSIANALEPGTFDLEGISELQTPGLMFVLQLPGPVDGATAFRRMLETVQAISERVGGQLCNEHREPLGAAQLAEIWERVRGFDAVARGGAGGDLESEDYRGNDSGYRQIQG